MGWNSMYFVPERQPADSHRDEKLKPKVNTKSQYFLSPWSVSSKATVIIAQVSGPVSARYFTAKFNNKLSQVGNPAPVLITNYNLPSIDGL